jgi:hypothetical protein
LTEQLYNNGSSSLLSGIRQALGYALDNPLRVPDYRPIILSLHHAVEMLLKVALAVVEEGFIKRSFTFQDVLDIKHKRVVKVRPGDGFVTFEEALSRVVCLFPKFSAHKDFLSALNSERNAYYHAVPKKSMDGERIHADNYERAERAILKRDKMVFCRVMPAAKDLLTIIGHQHRPLMRATQDLLNYGLLTVKMKTIDPLKQVARFLSAGRSFSDVNGAKRLATAQMYYYPLRRSWKLVAMARRARSRAISEAKRKDASKTDTCVVCGEQILLWGEHDDDGTFYLTHAECIACGLELGWFVQELYQV